MATKAKISAASKAEAHKKRITTLAERIRIEIYKMNDKEVLTAFYYLFSAYSTPNPQNYRKTIIELACAVENIYILEKNFSIGHNQVLDRLLNIHKFFMSINPVNLEKYLDVLNLEYEIQMDDKVLEKLEKKYPEIDHGFDFNLDQLSSK